MDKKEFNTAMARLDNTLFNGKAIDNYYSDLNLLMPLAWKHGVIGGEVRTGLFMFSISGDDFEPIVSAQSDDPAVAIRQCLWSIAESENDT